LDRSQDWHLLTPHSPILEVDRVIGGRAAGLQAHRH
jgi:hypothetical protein